MNTNDQSNVSSLTMILAESELERIPSSIQHHPQIKAYAKNRDKLPTELLLDASYHHAAMKKLPEWSRRGRPDIVHRCILFALDSWANTHGLLRFYIHTRNDFVITIHPKTRLPRQYHRFIGLIEQLFDRKEIRSSDDVLLSLKKNTLEELLADQRGKTVLFWEKGKNRSVADLIKSYEPPLTIVIGGFPHGDFHKASHLIEQKFAVEDELFTASYLVAKTIVTFEQLSCNHQ